MKGLTLIFLGCLAVPVMAADKSKPAPTPPAPSAAVILANSKLVDPQADVLQLSKRAIRIGDFASQSRNPFASSFIRSNQTTGAMSAEQVWDFVTQSLPVVGVNINEEDPASSTLIMGDVELTVGKPLPKYVLDAPVEVVLTSLDSRQAMFRIIITDQNQDDANRVKAQDFSLRFDGLVPKIENKSKYVGLPISGGMEEKKAPEKLVEKPL